MEPPGSARHRWGKPRGRNGREHISQPGKRTSFISSIAIVARLIRPRKLCARLACSTSNLKDLT